MSCACDNANDGELAAAPAASSRAFALAPAILPPTARLNAHLVSDDGHATCALVVLGLVLYLLWRSI